MSSHPLATWVNNASPCVYHGIIDHPIPIAVPPFLSTLAPFLSAELFYVIKHYSRNGYPPYVLTASQYTQAMEFIHAVMQHLSIVEKLRARYIIDEWDNAVSIRSFELQHYDKIYKTLAEYLDELQTEGASDILAEKQPQVEAVRLQFEELKTKQIGLLTAAEERAVAAKIKLYAGKFAKLVAVI